MKNKFKHFIGLLLLCVFAGTCSACASKNGETSEPDNGNRKTVMESCDVIGAGGYGAMYDISIDPFNDNIFAARCDMGGLYLSYDKGGSWTRHNFLGVLSDIDFDEENEGVLWTSGSGLYKSEDHGRTFDLVFPSKDSIVTQGSGYENTGETYYTTNPDYDPSGTLSSIAINRKSGGKNIFVAQKIVYWDGRENVTRIFETDNGKDFKKFVDLPSSDYVKLEYDESNDCLIVVTEKELREVNQEGKTTWSKPIKLMTEVNNTIFFDSYYDRASDTNTFAFSAVEENRPHSTTSLYYTHDLTDENSYVDLVTLLNGKKLGEVKKNCTEEEANLASYEFYRRGVKYSFDWETEYVHVASSDCVYFYSELGSEADWISCFLQYNAGEFKWIYGSPHTYAYDIANPSWQDYASMGRCFGMATSSKNVDYFAFSTIGTVYFTPDGEKISQCHCTVGKDITLTAKDGNGNEETITQTDGWIPLKETTTSGLNVENTYVTKTDPFDENHLLMACTDLGLIQSFNGGKTWVHTLTEWKGNKTEPMSSSYRNACRDIEFDKERQGVVYGLWGVGCDIPYSPAYNALTLTGAFGISYDGGISWTMSPIRENNQVLPYRMDVDYKGENRDIYIATYGYGFFVTHDLGQTFEEMNDGIVPSTYLGADQPAIFGNEILSCEDGIYAICGGSAWALKDAEKEFYDRALYKWNDGLKKFEEIPLPKEVATVRDIEYSEKEKCLYLGAIGRTHWQTRLKVGGGVYRYKDGELKQIFDESKFIWGLALDSRGTLYAAEFRGSVYRFSENNTKSELLVDGLFHVLKDITFGENDNTFYVSTFGGGTYRITLKYE